MDDILTKVVAAVDPLIQELRKRAETAEAKYAEAMGQAPVKVRTWRVDSPVCWIEWKYEDGETMVRSSTSPEWRPSIRTPKSLSEQPGVRETTPPDFPAPACAASPTCPVCGTLVRVASSGDGTNYYVPTLAERILARLTQLCLNAQTAKSAFAMGCRDAYSVALSIVREESERKP